jgi:hypothetical protein
MPSVTTCNPSEVAATEFLNAQHGGFAKILIEAKQLASMPSKAWILIEVRKHYTSIKPCPDFVEDPRFCRAESGQSALLTVL